MKKPKNKIECQSCGKRFGIDETHFSWDWIENELIVSHPKEFCKGKYLFETYSPIKWAEYYWEHFHREY